MKGFFPREFTDGENMGAGWEPDGEREKGGYPVGFFMLGRWNVAMRWFAGFNLGCGAPEAVGAMSKPKSKL